MENKGNDPPVKKYPTPRIYIGNRQKTVFTWRERLLSSRNLIKYCPTLEEYSQYLGSCSFRYLAE